MTHKTITTIAKGLDVSEISRSKGFSCTRVIDTRCEANRARPIEEAVLKRLKNHFVDYTQMPIDLSDAGPCQEIHLCEMIREMDADTMVIADDLGHLSALLNIYSIEFKSNSFYIVETGKGEVIKPVFDDVAAAQAEEPEKFGTFGG